MKLDDRLTVIILAALAALVSLISLLSSAQPDPTLPPRQAPYELPPEPEPDAPVPIPEPRSATVYRTRSGERYHLAHCQHVRGKAIPLSLAEARDWGLTPCKTCLPPPLR